MALFGALLACSTAVGAKPTKVPTPAYDLAVLGHIEQGIADQDVVVFDLDHTLFDGRSRTLQLLHEFAATLGPEQREAAANIRKIRIEDIEYLVSDTLGKVGVKEPAIVDAAKSYWLARFLSNDYLAFDVPLPGAVAYVNRLRQKGAFVVYLTGRDAPNMLVGTTRSLQRWGFPIGVTNTQLILKPKRDVPDLEFKQQALAQIARLGRVVAVFENEPKNLNAMVRKWPQAVAVFLDTDHNPGHAAALVQGAHRIPDYRTGAP